MPKEKLKRLKNHIDIHKSELIKKYAYVNSLLKAITILVEANASDRVIKAWIQGSTDMIVEVEGFVYSIEHDKYTLLRQRLEHLHRYMQKYNDMLLLKYPLYGIIFDGVDTLLQMEDAYSLMLPWVKSNNQVIKEIEKDIELFKSSSVDK